MTTLATDEPDMTAELRTAMRTALKTASTHRVHLMDVLMPPWRVVAERNAQIMRDDTPIYHSMCRTRSVYPHDQESEPLTVTRYTGHGLGHTYRYDVPLGAS